MITITTIVPSKMTDDQNSQKMSVGYPVTVDVEFSAEMNYGTELVYYFTGICTRNMQSPEKSSTLKFSQANLPPELSTRFQMVLNNELIKWACDKRARGKEYFNSCT